MGKVQNILVVTKTLLAAGGRHIYLWPEATRLSKSHVPTEIGTMVTINILDVYAFYILLTKYIVHWTFKDISRIIYSIGYGVIAVLHLTKKAT